jgi:hypothetical protein
MLRVPRRARAAIDVLRAAVAVMGARRIVARRPIGELVARQNGETASMRHHSSSTLSSRARLEGARWATAVDRALRVLPGDAACLVRATALRALLASHAVPDATVRIGVRRGSGAFAAHAWVEVSGTPIAEPEDVAGLFAPLDGVTLR